MITPTQMRAARAMLDLSQGDVAKSLGIAANTLSNIESGKTDVPASRLAEMRKFYELQGIVFTAYGVELRENALSIIEGDNWYLRLLEDVYMTLSDKPNTELLLICADDKMSPPEVNQQYRKIRSTGAKMRQLVEEGNTYLMGPVEEYRYMPKERFNNYVSLIYGEKVAVCTDANTKALVFKDSQLSKTWTNVFNVMWDILEQPRKSDATERF